MGDKYMGGVDIMQHTANLTERLWDCVPRAIIGSTLASTVPLISALMLFAPSGSFIVPLEWLAIANALAIPGGIWMASAYWRAHAALAKHRRAMEAETALRGSGWARS